MSIKREPAQCRAYNNLEVEVLIGETTGRIDVKIRWKGGDTAGFGRGFRQGDENVGSLEVIILEGCRTPNKAFYIGGKFPEQARSGNVPEPPRNVPGTFSEPTLTLISAFLTACYVTLRGRFWYQSRGEGAVSSFFTCKTP